MAKITTDIFKERVKNLGNNEYELVSEYINVKTKVTIKHLTCGHVYNVRPDAFTSGQRCPKCFGKHRKSNDDIKAILKDEYKLLSDYKNNKSKIKLKHLECGHEYEVIADHILRCKGYLCPKCKGKRLQVILKKSTGEYQQQLNKFIGNKDYKVVSDYINERTKIKVLHIPCNTEFEALPNKILYGTKRCPKCFPNKSLGEMLVEQYLLNNNLKYSLQYTFNECVSSKQKPLRFDFAVFNENNRLDYLIEYDGQQHYSPVEIFGGEESFKIQKENDTLKDEFCSKNNIKLIRIPYQVNNYEKLVRFMEEI